MLASRADVAAALGLEDEDALSEPQQARVDALLERVSSSVTREAQRDFTPGPMTVQVLVIDGRIYLPDMTEVTNVTTAEGEVAAESDVPGWFTVSRNGTPLLSGDRVTVEAVRGSVPDGVKALVAGIVARQLTVEPGSPESKAVELTAGTHYRWRGADWVYSTSLLTSAERAEARNYRSTMPNIIIHQL